MSQLVCLVSSVGDMAEQALVLNSQLQQLKNEMTSGHSAAFSQVWGVI